MTTSFTKLAIRFGGAGNIGNNLMRLSFKPAVHPTIGQRIGSSIDNGISKVIGGFRAVGNAVNATGNVVNNGFRAAGNAITGGFRATGNAVANGFSAIGNGVRNSVNFVRNSAANGLTNAADKLRVKPAQLAEQASVNAPTRYATATNLSNEGSPFVIHNASTPSQVANNINRGQAAAAPSQVVSSTNKGQATTPSQVASNINRSQGATRPVESEAEISLRHQAGEYTKDEQYARAKNYLSDIDTAPRVSAAYANQHGIDRFQPIYQYHDFNPLTGEGSGQYITSFKPNPHYNGAQKVQYLYKHPEDYFSPEQLQGTVSPEWYQRYGR